MSISRALPIQFNEDQVERFSRIAAELSRQAHGVRVSRSEALRVVIELGVQQLEKQLGKAFGPARETTAEALGVAPE